MKYFPTFITAFVICSFIAIRIGEAQNVPPSCYWDNYTLQVVCDDGGSNDDNGGSSNPGSGNGGGSSNPGSGNGGGNNNSGCISNGVIADEHWIPYYNPLGRGPFWYYRDEARLYDKNMGVISGESPVFYPQLPEGQSYCPVELGQFDNCGNFLGLRWGLWNGIANCGGEDEDYEPPVTNPCDITGAWTGSGFSATCHSDWECTAAVPLPPTYIDTRPYPVTLVRWPTAIRCSGQEKSNGSCSVSDAGDLDNFRLSLEFRPATGIVVVTLPYLPTMTFNASSPTGQPTLFQWEVPSHPAVGANRLAGTLNGFFDEIPGDFPVFEGHMKTPYHLYWNVSFDKNGNHYSFDGELLPQDVTDLPASMFADLNGDGTVDAYWDPNFVISRMDENNRTDNPLYERHWSYGELLPWAVREGQGQIGWPNIH